MRRHPAYKVEHLQRYVDEVARSRLKIATPIQVSREPPPKLNGYEVMATMTQETSRKAVLRVAGNFWSRPSEQQTAILAHECGHVIVEPIGALNRRLVGRRRESKARTAAHVLLVDVEERVVDHLEELLVPLLDPPYESPPRRHRKAARVRST